MADQNTNVIARLPLGVSEGIRKQVNGFATKEEGLLKQGQIRIPSGNADIVKGLLEPLGLKMATKKSPVLLTLRSPKGTEVQLVWNDPYAFWFKHQKTHEAKTLIAYLMTKDGDGTFDVIDCQPLTGLVAGTDSPQGVDSMEDCPL